MLCVYHQPTQGIFLDCETQNMYDELLPERKTDVGTVDTQNDWRIMTNDVRIGGHQTDSKCLFAREKPNWLQRDCVSHYSFIANWDRLMGWELLFTGAQWIPTILPLTLSHSFSRVCLFVYIASRLLRLIYHFTSEALLLVPRSIRNECMLEKEM